MNRSPVQPARINSMRFGVMSCWISQNASWKERQAGREALGRRRTRGVARCSLQHSAEGCFVRVVSNRQSGVCWLQCRATGVQMVFPSGACNGHRREGEVKDRRRGKRVAALKCEQERLSPMGIVS